MAELQEPNENSWFQRIRGVMATLAVLQPVLLIFVVVLVLPFTSWKTSIPVLGSMYGMTGNLFSDYEFWGGLLYAVTLSGVWWALLLSVCTILDTERDKERAHSKEGLPPWLPDANKDSWLTLPVPNKTSIRGLWVLVVLLLVPMFHTTKQFQTLGGLVVGFLLAYFFLVGMAWLTLSVSQVEMHEHPDDETLHEVRVFKTMWLSQLMPPRPEAPRWPTRWTRKLLHEMTTFARNVGLSPVAFMGRNKQLLAGGHLFAALNIFGLLTLLFVFLFALHPSLMGSAWLPEFPAVAFVFAWLSVVVWAVSGVWLHLRPYRFMIVAALLWTWFWYFVGEYTVPAFVCLGLSGVFLVYLLRGTSLLRGLAIVLMASWIGVAYLGGYDAKELVNPAHTFSLDHVTIRMPKKYYSSQILYPEELLCSLNRSKSKSLDASAGVCKTLHKVDRSVSSSKERWKLRKANILQRRCEKPTLILAAASGGGILAAGWTTRVLTSLQRAYPPLAQELRLISANSGGSVGTAHYLNGFHATTKKARAKNTKKRKQTPQSKKNVMGYNCDEEFSESGLPKPNKDLNVFGQIMNNSVRSSLSVTGYGLFFVDMLRLFLPIKLATGRGQMLDQNWSHYASEWLCNKWCDEKAGSFNAKTCRLCRKRKRIRLYDLREPIRDGKLPGFIFHSTVMETGELLALTPLSVVSQRQWKGQTYCDLLDRRRAKQGSKAGPKIELDSDYEVDRFINIRTLSHFMNPKSICFEGKKLSHYTLDLWSAARLSATFSYVSPAARAVLNQGSLYKGKTPKQTRESLPDGFGLKQWGREEWASKKRIYNPSGLPSTNLGYKAIKNSKDLENMKLHLIDGGYHENYGVQTILAWLDSILHYYTDIWLDKSLNNEDDEPRKCGLINPSPARKNALQRMISRWRGEGKSQVEINNRLEQKPAFRLHRRLPFGRIVLIEIRAGKDSKRLTEPSAGSWSAALLGPFLGLLSSWSLSQRSSNDSLLYQMRMRLKEYDIPFESFVFSYPKNGPLSWHLSNDQKADICRAWTGEPKNEKERKEREKLKDVERSKYEYLYQNKHEFKRFIQFVRKERPSSWKELEDFLKRYPPLRPVLKKKP
ncbi:MAG: hypothetical protein EP343_26100 [Deltaproteobacteria bacterium]|nr:MAG: hypothetical protein EP343_26100 [Deltaproteobacteria bacterium]